MQFPWLKNIPVPEPFIAALIPAGLLQVFFPVPILTVSLIWVWLGAVLIVSGLIIATWAVIVAGEMDLEHPTTVLTGGPYMFSRNPMYLCWAIASIGLAVLLNSLWLVVSVLIAVIYMNFVTIPAEERRLQTKFSSEYEAYRRRVRRWL